MDRIAVYVLEQLRKTNSRTGLLVVGFGAYVIFSEKRRAEALRKISELEKKTDTLILEKEREP